MVATLILGGILMIVLERVIAEKNLRTGYIGKPLEMLSYNDALIIGMAQSFAIILAFLVRRQRFLLDYCKDILAWQLLIFFFYLLFR